MSTLYHYCSTSSFFSIVNSASIWLSSLSQSNDSLEGKIVSASVAQLAEQDKLDERTRSLIEQHIRQIEESTEALGFCLSEEGDLLSQWRGYAQDATGFAIGFNTDYLEGLCAAGHPLASTPVVLKKVRYSPAEQKELLGNTYKRFQKLAADSLLRKAAWSGTAGKSVEQIRGEVSAFATQSDAVLGAQIQVFSDLYLLKNVAFAEEKEWRLLAPYLSFLPEALDYRHANSQIIPFRSYTLTAPVDVGIARVILGPKNKSPESVVKDFLHSRGFRRAIVERSSATYR